MKDAHKEVECTICTKTMRCFDNLQLQMKQHTFKCSRVCKKSFQRALGYTSFPVNCKACERNFCNMNDLECHQRTEHPVKKGHGTPVNDVAWEEALNSS